MADMWTMINRELAKMERARGGASDTPYLDVISETMKYAKEDRAWRERKSLQRQQMMSTLSKDTSRMYNNDDVKIHRERFKKYYDKNKGDMDEISLEMGQMLLQNFDIQMEKNDSFNKYEARQDYEMKKIQDYLAGTDEKKGLEVGKEYSDEQVEEFRKIFQGYVNYTEEFAGKHADRLQLASNQHVNKSLAYGTYMNEFMIDSIFEDNKIDKVEYKAYKQSIAMNSIQPIKDYNDYQSSLIRTSSQALVEEIEGDVQKYKDYTSIQNNKVPVPKEWAGDMVGVFYDDAGDEIQDAIDAEALSLAENIKGRDETHIVRHGESYIDYQHQGLFEIPDTPIIKDKPTPDKTTPSGKKKAKYSDSDVTTIANWIDNKNTKVGMEFKRAKRKSPDMTLREFLENRPDLAEDAKKESKKWKTISDDARKYLDREYDFTKQGKRTEKTENGKKVRFTTYYMSPDTSDKDIKGGKYRKKIVSTYHLKNSTRDALNYLGATLGGYGSSWAERHDRIANAKLKSIKEVYDPFQMKWVITEIKDV